MGPVAELVPSVDANGGGEASRQAANRPAVKRGVLERLRVEMHAGRVALVRFDHDDASFEVVAATGVPFLATGVTLPIGSSSILLTCAQGRWGAITADHSPRPLDRIAASLGLRCGIGIPLTVAGAVVGALTVLWEAETPPVEDPASVVKGSQVALLRMLLASEPEQRRVLVCHENRLVAEGLAHMAEQALGVIADVASSVTSAIAALTVGQPDLIVCSDRLSESERLPRVARRLRAAGAAAPMMALARTDSGHCFESAIQAGATGYLPLAMAADDFPQTAAALLNGRSALYQPTAGQVGPRLTERERDVLLGFERGLCDKEIARELGVAISTVKTHARAIYGKLDATSRTAALHKARLAGLI